MLFEIKNNYEPLKVLKISIAVCTNKTEQDRNLRKVVSAFVNKKLPKFQGAKQTKLISDHNCFKRFLISNDLVCQKNLYDLLQVKITQL